MPRIRTIKPSFFFDDDLTEHPRDVRWLYVGIWTLCDEWGVFEYKPKAIKGHLYAFDDDVTRDTIAAWTECLIASAHIHLFESEGKTYGFIPSFMEHQYFDSSCRWRYPEPPKELIALSPSYKRRICNGVQTSLDDSQTSLGVKGKRGGGRGLREGLREKEGEEEARSEKEFAASPPSTSQQEKGAIPPSESESEESLSEGDREIIAVWRSVKGFRMPAENAATLVADLRREFPRIDLLAESKTWAARKLSEPLTTRSRPSGQLWSWMRKAQQFAQERRQHDDSAKNAKRPRGEIDPDKYTKGRLGHLVQR